MTLWDLFQGCKAAAVLDIQCNPPYKQANEKKKGNIVLTTDAEEAFDEIKHSFLKSLRKLE